MLATIPGCTALQALLGESDKPNVTLAGARLEGLSPTSATLLFDVNIANPYTVDLPLARLDYALASRGKEFLVGKAEATGTVPAKGSRTIPVPAKITFTELLSALDGVKPGAVVPYAANIIVSLDVPGGSKLALPLRKEGEIPVPTVPEIALDGIEWSDLSFDKASALLRLRIVNRNDFALDLSKLSYGLTLGTARVAEASVDQAVAFAAGGENTLQVRASFVPKDLGVAAFTMLTGSGSSYELGGTMSVTTPFGPLELPYKRAGQTVFKK